MNWTKDDEKKLLKAVSKATTVAEAIDAARLALPGLSLTHDKIAAKLRRIGEPALAAICATNAAKVHSGAEGDALARFVSVAKKGHTLEELCDRLDMSPKKAKAMVEAAKTAGYSIHLSAGTVGYVPPQPFKGIKKVVARPEDQGIFAVISDLHYGSLYCLENQIIDFVHRAYDEGVRTIFLGGDNCDGVYKFLRFEQAQHGYQAQAKRMATRLPQRSGLRYVGIAGNHDETFEKDSGMSFCHALPLTFKDHGRDDLEMIGARGAYVRFAPKGGRGVLVELWHPMGGGAYAVSYKLQRHVEEYGVGQKPDFLFAGHWHQQCYIVRRGVHCFSAGTFHGGGSSFGKALGGAQAIGGWVVRYGQTKDGTLRDVQPTWRAYYENETVRDAKLA